MKRPNLIFRGRIERGQIQLVDPQRFEMRLKQLEGKEIEITIQKERKKRSNQQNAYYWGCVIAIFADSLGYEPEELHEALKWQFLRTHSDKPDLPSVRSTTDLDTAEFTEYIEQIRRFAAEKHGCIIPSPGEVEI